MLFATGLLIALPAAGWAVLAGIACRLVSARWSNGDREVFGAGVIAGDALVSFAGSVSRASRTG